MTTGKQSLSEKERPFKATRAWGPSSKTTSERPGLAKTASKVPRKSRVSPTVVEVPTTPKKPSPKYRRYIIAVVVALVTVAAATGITLGLVLDSDNKSCKLQITAIPELSSIHVEDDWPELKENSNSLYKADIYEFESVPEFIAVSVDNDGEFIGSFLLASVVEDDDTLVTTNSADWRCTHDVDDDDEDWTTSEYDDSSWNVPIEISQNGDFEDDEVLYTPYVADDAHWITSRLGTSHLYCRYKANRDQSSEKTLDVGKFTETFEQQVEGFVAGTNEGDEPPLQLILELLDGNVLSDKLPMPGILSEGLSEDDLQSLRAAVKSATDDLREVLIEPIKADGAFTLPSLTSGVCLWPEYDCDDDARYRSFDGSCNNLDNPLYGRSFSPFKRLLPQVYDDGKGALQTLSSAGRPLPGARLVSSSLSREVSRPHRLQTLMVMVWGQFMDHDMDLAPVSTDKTQLYGRKSDITCGEDACSTTEHEACKPIAIPDDDPGFSMKKCIEFIRVKPHPDENCTEGLRTQINVISSYIDASTVYGSTAAQAKPLRDYVDPGRGRLLVQSHPDNPALKPLLPTNPTVTDCHGLDDDHLCFKAGDGRVNEHHALTILHVLSMREHNRIEAELHRVNPLWDGDVLYEETRRIMGAIMQHINYNEYVGLVLGTQWREDPRLKLLTTGYYDGYNASINGAISNVFGVAAFRFGHSTIPSFMQRSDANWNPNVYPQLPLSEQFFRPRELYNTKNGGLDGFIRGAVDQVLDKCDRFVTEQLTIHMFTNDPPTGEGLDLFAINTQRGRDHGMPSYNDWREYCGLERAADFDDLVDMPDTSTRNIFRRIYNHVDDIELYPAGISEKPLVGGLVGPTFACLIAEQFIRTRQGDRMWYENPDSVYEAFTPDQLQEIRKVRLSKLLCDNSDEIEDMQPYALLLPFRHAYTTSNYSDYDPEDHGLSEAEFVSKWEANFNARVPCPQLPSMNFSAWQE